jgi:oligopeptide transport system ATP-binding protein
MQTRIVTVERRQRLDAPPLTLFVALFIRLRLFTHRRTLHPTTQPAQDMQDMQGQAPLPKRRGLAPNPPTSPTNLMPLLSIDNLHTVFETSRGTVRAVNGVSLAVNKGETIGIVGESGSGKSVTCYSIMGLLPKPAGRVEQGRALFDGVDLLQCGRKELQKIRGRRIAMIFQDPMTSLNPYLRVGEQLIEPLLIHEGVSRKEAAMRAAEALRDTGIQDAERRLRQYPHEFSGGMRQRVMIAMALITKPDLLIADEPTTALDVTVQAQILELIRSLQATHGMGVIFITHDLGIISGMCDHVAVMYAGRVLETGETTAVLKTPRHPYTRALQKSLPMLQGRGAELYTIPGNPPDMMQEISGCPFAPRCDRVNAECGTADMALREVATEQDTACVREGEELE